MVKVIDCVLLVEISTPFSFVVVVAITVLMLERLTDAGVLFLSEKIKYQNLIFCNVKNKVPLYLVLQIDP